MTTENGYWNMLINKRRVIEIEIDNISGSSSKGTSIELGGGGGGGYCFFSK